MGFNKFILYSLVIIHVIALFYAFVNQQRLLSTINSVNPPNPSKNTDFLGKVLESSSTHTHQDRKNNEYRFINPALAYQVLRQLDVYIPCTELDPNIKIRTAFNFSKVYYGLKPDDDYCDKHRAYFVEHPDSIFKEMNVLLARSSKTFISEDAVEPVAKLANPKNNFLLPEKLRNSPVFDVDLTTTCFFTPERLYPHLQLGKQFSCLSQESNHILDSTTLSMKNRAAESAAAYMEKFKDRPQCLSQGKYFPKTWILTDQTQCEEFFRDFNSPEYKRLQKERRIVYIRKETNAHRGDGVQPVNEQDEAYIRKTYGNGSLCGKVKLGNIIQHYIHNPLLVKGHKFDFRLYLLVASTNPVIAYYHDGFLRVSLEPYDKNSNDKKVLLTNLALNNKIYGDVKQGALYNGMNEEQLKLAQQWSYEKLQKTLLEENVINDTNWLDNYLRPEFKKCMIHMVRMAQGNFAAQSSTFELYGVDFMLDEDLNVWFIEANAGPAFDGYSEPMGKFIAKMLQDHLEVVHGLLRSRMKRVVDYVNKIINEGMVIEREQGDVSVIDLEKRREEFSQITKNYFESEFAPKPENGFVKIIDENYHDINIYNGVIAEECL